MLLTLEEEHRLQWEEAAPEIPYGLCQCGCGNPTSLSQVNNKNRGWVRGCPLRFLPKHHNRKQRNGRDDGGVEAYKRRWLEDAPDIPYGSCQCGCGKETPIASRSETKRGQIKGEPKRFALRHHPRKRIQYCIEDRGFDTPCWVWQLSKTRFGYPMMHRVATTSALAHRIYYEEKYGSVPDNKQLDHLCRVRACVNPDHLEPVTNAENSQRGANATLSWKQVRQIRSIYDEYGPSFTELGAAFGVSRHQISNIIHNRSWSEASAKAIGLDSVGTVEIKDSAGPITQLPETGPGQ